MNRDVVVEEDYFGAVTLVWVAHASEIFGGRVSKVALRQRQQTLPAYVFNVAILTKQRLGAKIHNCRLIPSFAMSYNPYGGE